MIYTLTCISIFLLSCGGEEDPEIIDFLTPQITEITNVTSSSVKLSWTDTQNLAVEVQFGTDLTFEEFELATSFINAKWIEIENLEEATTYYFRIRSTIDGNYSDFSEIKDATTL